MKATITAPEIRVRLNADRPFDMETFVRDGELHITIRPGVPTPITLPGQLDLVEELEKIGER